MPRRPRLILGIVVIVVGCVALALPYRVDQLISVLRPLATTPSDESLQARCQLDGL